MTREEFLRMSALFGLSIPFAGNLLSCKKDKTNPSNVIIIGAGAAGMSAAYFLTQRGINVRVLEAQSTYGGRIRTTNSFTDFPIPLGAEWLHIETSFFSEVVNNSVVPVNVNTVGYTTTDPVATWQNGQMNYDQMGAYADRKFVNGSWLGFFEQYILPSVSDKITYNSVVQSIDYTQDDIKVKTQNAEYTAERVLVTVPLKMLQLGKVSFSPALPSDKTNAINNATVWGGIKVFLEFSQAFYPTFVDKPITPSTLGWWTYYDAAYGQNTTKNILGLFAVGQPAEAYTSLSGNALKDYILNELDTMFSNQATPAYVKHVVQNWSQEPFFESAYISDHENYSLIERLFAPVGNKLYFAGEAYTSGNDWGGVHAAARAAKEAVDLMIT